MAAKKIDPNAQYRVTLKERAEYFGTFLFPGREYEMKGDVVALLGDKVETAELIQF